MDYVEESLTGNEKVVIVGRFHWVYFIGAWFWIILGFLLCGAIIAAGTAWNIHHAVGVRYPSLPDHLYNQAWHMVVTQAGGYVAIMRDLNIYFRVAAFAVLLLGVFLFAHMMVVRLTTEIAVTSSRLILKEGIIARNVDEMSVDRIESVHVVQSIFGRLLNYGTVMVRGMGIGEIVLPPMADPISFRNALEKARQYQEKQRRL